MLAFQHLCAKLPFDDMACVCISSCLGVAALFGIVFAVWWVGR